MPELRKDPVIGRWVIISTERGRRPSEFFQTPQPPRNGFCALCEGNEDKTPPEVFAIRKDNSPPNTPGWLLRVVPNKFPALRVEGDLNPEGQGIYDKMNGIGAHEVVIETPQHDATSSSLPEGTTRNVLVAYRERIVDLTRDPRLLHVMAFKNSGAAAGATLEHPHSQIVALPIIPKRLLEEIQGSKHYYEHEERCIFCDILRQELSQKDRVISENDGMVAIAPFASRFPFETWILPKRHSSHYTDISEGELADLALLLHETLARIDRALSHPPYNYVLHTDSPRNEQAHYYHWHIEIMPKLTRVAGFEWGTGFYINPTPPEEAAQFLRAS